MVPVIGLETCKFKIKKNNFQIIFLNNVTKNDSVACLVAY